VQNIPFSRAKKIFLEFLKIFWKTAWHFFYGLLECPYEHWETPYLRWKYVHAIQGSLQFIFSPLAY
jgi:hypothetical protein